MDPIFGSEFPPEPTVPLRATVGATPRQPLEIGVQSLFKVAPKVNIVYNSLARVNKQLSEGGTAIEEVDIVGGSDATDSAGSYCSRLSAGPGVL